MADRYPSEVEFYVPQLCTYLFSFEAGDGNGTDRDSFEEDEQPEGPGSKAAIEETKQS